MRKSVAVVGAGWAGLAAAIRLVEAGHTVTLVDAAPGCGGRARGIRSGWQGYFPAPASSLDPDPSSHLDRGPSRAIEHGEDLDLDNGQHLVIGAYQTLLDLLARIGITEAEVIERHRFRLDDGQGLLIPGPGLMGLVRARGLGWPLKKALVRLVGGIALGREAALGRARGRTVASWSQAEGHPPALLTRLLEPLVLATMNTPVRLACAETFVRVLADSLAGPARATDFLLPRPTLSTMFVDPALAWLDRQGATIRTGCDVRGLAGGRRPNSHRLLTGRDAGGRNGGDEEDFDGLVLATPPANAARILAQAAPAVAMAPGLIEALKRFDYRPITTVYLGWPEDEAGAGGGVGGGIGVGAKPGPGRDRWARLPIASLLHDAPALDQHGQWLFRRPSQHGWRLGAVVISDSSAALALGREALAAATAHQVSEALGLPPARAWAIFTDRRATIACSPDRPRLATAIGGLRGLVLAGDYQYHAYPATLESALRSGCDAAATLNAQLAA